MTVQERILPQLMMKRPSLLGLEKVVLPKGCHLRCYQGAQDDTYWEKIIAESFSQDYPVGYFARTLKSSNIFKPDRVLFICCNEVPVATASAWHNPKFGAGTGQVHYVGVLPNQQGKRLGYYISLAVLHQFALEGFKDAILETDDFRVPAIKTYLKLGFEPFLTHDNHRRRWKEVFREIHSDGESEKSFSYLLNGPIRYFE